MNEVQQSLIERIIRYIDQPHIGFTFHSAEVLGNVIIVMISRGNVSRDDAESVENMAAAGNALWAELEAMAAGTGIKINMIAVGG